MLAVIARRTGAGEGRSKLKKKSQIYLFSDNITDIEKESSDDSKERKKNLLKSITSRIAESNTNMKYQ